MTPLSPSHRLRVALLEHPREPSWEHLNDVANAPLSASLLTPYLAAVLERAGHEVCVVEGHLGRLSPQECVRRVADARPDLLGIHVVYDWSDGAALRRLLGDLAEATGGAPAIVYGFYPTFAWSELLPTLPGVAAAVLGEPEATWAEAAAALAGAARAEPARALRGVPGLAVRLADGPARATAPRALIDDLDALPFPRRSPELFGLREVNVAGSRGCYGACTFCTINSFYGPASRWRPRTPENVAAEIEAVLAERPDKRRFYFVDPNFFGPGRSGRRRALALARLLRERFSIRFGLEGRVNDIDEEVVGALVEAGFDEILIGLESGSDQTLARLNKRTTVEQNRRALRILRAHGIEPNVGFIMFEPGSRLEDVRTNLAFLEEEGLLSRLSVTVNVLYHQQILLAGTPAYRAARADGSLVPAAHNPYEGRVAFRHPEVAFLAETMAEVSRHVLSSVPPEAWEREAVRPDPALAALNRRLVALFRDLLDGVDSGEVLPTPEVARQVVDGIRATLRTLPAAGPSDSSPPLCESTPVAADRLEKRVDSRRGPC
ncbi:MAG: hypothetical protein Kow0092_18790 [Deferrisomatales bacterium]